MQCNTEFWFLKTEGRASRACFAPRDRSACPPEPCAKEGVSGLPAGALCERGPEPFAKEGATATPKKPLQSPRLPVHFHLLHCTGS